MYDPFATYRSTQVASSSPAAQVVLLYQGALRFGAQHISALERNDIQAAHNASIRCQAIVAALQQALDMSVAPVARQLDTLYDFCLRRLAEGNISKRPEPTREALVILRELLEAWEQIAGNASPAGVAALQDRSAGTIASVVAAR